MKNKGQLSVLIIPLVIALVVIAGLIAFFVSGHMRYIIIGVGILLATFVYAIPAVLSSDVTKGKIGILLILLSMGALFIIIPSFMQASYASGEVQLAIPHYGSFECKSVEQKLGQSLTIPNGGVLLSGSTIGFYTNGISTVKTSVAYGFWTSLIKDLRLRYTKCDQNGNNCGPDVIVKYVVSGQRQNVLDSVDFKTSSIRVYFEQLTFLNAFIGKWTPYDKATISYDANRYALVYHSTTQDLAGAVICSTSCDLNCKDIGVTQKLTFIQEDILGFGLTAPAFEYWDDIPYDLNAQGGATVYNSATNSFCFSGVIYAASKMTTQTGVTYIFPDVDTKQYKLCCPGATIVSTYSDKVCQSDYTWKTIADTDKLTCISDAVCPGAGNLICQDKQLSNGYSCTDKDTNGVGLCKRASGTAVDCCLSSDCNRDMVCDLSTHTCKGGTIYPHCGDRIVQAGETCDDGNTQPGDGCGASCQLEGTTPVGKTECLAQNGVGSNRYQWVETQSSSCGYNPLCYAGWMKPKVTTSGYCKDNYQIYWIVGIVGGILILIIILLLAWPRRSPSRRRRR